MEAFCDSGIRWYVNKNFESEARYSQAKKKEKNKVKFVWLLLTKKLSGVHGNKTFVWTFEECKIRTQKNNTGQKKNNTNPKKDEALMKILLHCQRLFHFLCVGTPYTKLPFFF